MNRKGKKINVYIPIEIALRETYPKAFLAAYLASKGYRVFVLPDYLMTRFSFDDGIVLGKNQIHIEKWRRKTGAKISFILLEEEGAHAFGDFEKRSSLVYGRLSHVIKIAKIVTAWGSWQAEAAKLFTSLPIEVTGTLYMEVCKPKYAEKALTVDREVTNGLTDYILINTRFAFANCNHAPYLSVTHNNPDFAYDQAVPSYWRTLASNDMTMLGAFIKLIELIARTFPDKKIVIRPHPAENQIFYKELFADFDNIIVSNSGFVLCWIRNATCVLANGCTTSLQAEVARKPVINYIPPQCHNTTDMTLFDEIGFTAHTEEMVIDAINQSIIGNLELFNVGKWVDKEGTFSLHMNFFEKIGRIVDDLSTEFEPELFKIDGLILDKMRYDLRNRLKILLQRFPKDKDFQNFMKYFDCANKYFGGDLTSYEPFENCFVIENGNQS